MPTKATDVLLDREQSIQQAKAVTDVAIPLLDELVNYGLAVGNRRLPKMKT
jgi:hypothetical protein